MVGEDQEPQMFFEVIESQRSNALSDLTDTGMFYMKHLDAPGRNILS